MEAMILERPPSHTFLMRQVGGWLFANVNRKDIMEGPAPDSQFVSYTGDNRH